jgi:hypothetical protein
MGQRLDRWHQAGDERLWLSLLIDAMEEASRPEIRALPCESSILKELRAQLAQPVSHRAYAATASNLRH